MTETGSSEKLLPVPVGAGEGPLIEESDWGAIRALWQRGVSKRGIARQLGLDIKTVRKWLREEWAPQRRICRGRMLDGFAEFVRGRAPEVGFNGRVVFRELQALGYEGSYVSVVRYLRAFRPPAGTAEVATLRFETAPGEQAQVDWGSTGVWFGEERVRVHVFVMVLGYSRRIFARAYPGEGLGSLLDGHEQAFAHFGGCPRKILYDNPRTIVLDKDESSGRVDWHPGFRDRMDFYGVEPRLCRYYRAQTKGKVESGVKYVKGNALVGRCFADLEGLNAWLLQWCEQVADQRIHGTTGERPKVRFERSEAAALMAVDLRPAPPRERIETRRVPRDGYAQVETNRYPLPLSWVGQQVEVSIQAEVIHFRLEDREPICHPRLEAGGHRIGRWHGEPRTIPRRAVPAVEPPRFDLAYLAAQGSVDGRSLTHYEALAQAGGR